MPELGTYWVTVASSTGGLQKALGAEFAGAEAGLAGGLSRGASKGAALAAKAIGGIGLFKLGTDAVRAGGEIQKAQASMAGLYGDAQLAEATLGDIRDVARDSSLSFSSYTSAGNALAYAGVQGDKAVKILDNVGKALVGAGKGSESLDQAANALVRFSSEGRVSLQALQQLSSAGVPIMDSLATSLGVSIERMREMVSANEVSIEQVLASLENATGSFFQAQIASSEEVERTFSATWERTKDSVQTSLGEAIIPLLEAATPLVDALATGLGAIPGPLVTAGLAVGGAVAAQSLLSAALGRASGAFAANTVAATANTTAIGRAAAAARGASARFGQVGKIGAWTVALWGAAEAATRLRDVFQEHVLPSREGGLGQLITGSTTDELVARIDNARHIYDGFGKVMQFGDWATGLVGIGDGMKDLDAGVKNIDEGFAELIANGNVDEARVRFEELSDALRAQGWTGDQIAAAFPSMAAGADELAGAIDGVAGSLAAGSDELNEWVDNNGLVAQLRDSAAAAEALDTILDDIATSAARALGGYLSVDEAQDAATRSQNALNEAILQAISEGYTGDYMDMEDTSKWALDLRDKQRDVERSTADLAEAWINAGEDADTVRERLGEMGEAFADDAPIFKGKGAVDQFTGALWTMQKAIDDTKGKWTDLQSALEWDEMTRDGNNEWRVGFGMIPSWDMPARAAGGPVEAGSVYRINELGVEAFEPAMSGTIIPLGEWEGRVGGPAVTIEKGAIDARGLSASQAGRVVSEFVAFRTGLKVGV